MCEETKWKKSNPQSETVIQEYSYILLQLPNKSRDVYMSVPLLVFSCKIRFKVPVWSLSVFWHPVRSQTVQFMSSSGIFGYPGIPSVGMNVSNVERMVVCLIWWLQLLLWRDIIYVCVCFSVCLWALFLYAMVPKCPPPPGVESGRNDHFVIHFSEVIGTLYFSMTVKVQIRS